MYLKLFNAEGFRIMKMMKASGFYVNLMAKAFNVQF